MCVVHLIGNTGFGKSVQFPQKRRVGALFASMRGLITHTRVGFDVN